MNLPPEITLVRHAGHQALQLSTRYGTAIVALHGAHLMSWQPAGQREVFWVSPGSSPEPAAIRGGVPVCWPWFAKQGMPGEALQHGPARIHPWQLSAVHVSNADEVSISLQPCALPGEPSSLAELAPGLEVCLQITLGRALEQTLATRNLGTQTFQLTQALHSYFSVSHPNRVGIEGLDGLPYLDKLRGMAPGVQHTPFAFEQACDRIYHAAPNAGSLFTGRYALMDAQWQRRIVIETQGSRSVVVWNPGREGARGIADVLQHGWQDFFCIEAANAGPDVVSLAPGSLHRLRQTLTIQ
jgi:glucose-6-phosphate 1-epimerase